MSSNLLAIGLLAGLGLAACWFDVSQRRLPNWLCVLVSLCGVGITLVTAGASALPRHLLHAFIALTIGMGLFALRVIGGGDAKYYAANAIWFGMDSALRLLVSVSLAGLVVLIVWALWRRSLGERVFSRGDDDTRKLPYGVAIAIGTLVVWLNQPGIAGGQSV